MKLDVDGLVGLVPWRIRYLWQCLRNWQDIRSVTRFLVRNDISVPLSLRLWFVWRIYCISLRVWCAHTQQEMLEVSVAVLQVPDKLAGVIVEAGCYKGGSTAKLSLLAKIANRKLIAFDSFDGLPSNDEPTQRTILGETSAFHQGAYRGGIEEVTENVKKYGDLDRCRFVKGWFSDTMVGFSDPVVGAFIDVDLVSSTKDCLLHLYPNLQPGCAIFSQDGHLPLIIDLLDDANFWAKEMGLAKPHIGGLRKRKLVRIGR